MKTKKIGLAAMYVLPVAAITIVAVENIKIKDSNVNQPKTKSTKINNK